MYNREDVIYGVIPIFKEENKDNKKILSQEQVNKILEDHLKWLKCHHWADWEEGEEKEEGEKADFSNTRLENISFKNKKIKQIDFSNSLLINVAFENSTGHLNDFTGARIYNCNLKDAYFGGGIWNNVEMVNCNLTNAQFTGVEILNCRFEKCIFANVEFDEPQIENTFFNKCNMPGTLFQPDGYFFGGTYREWIEDMEDEDDQDYYLGLDRPEKLFGVSFHDCNLANAEFAGLTLESSTFANCDCRNVKLWFLHIGGTCFRNCNCTHTAIDRTDINYSSFTHCDFSNAIYANGYMRKTKCRNLKFDQVTITDIVFSENEWYDVLFKNIKIFDSVFKLEYFNNTYFLDAYTSETDFKEIEMEYCEIINSIFESGKWEKADFENVKILKTKFFCDSFEIAENLEQYPFNLKLYNVLFNCYRSIHYPEQLDDEWGIEKKEVGIFFK